MKAPDQNEPACDLCHGDELLAFGGVGAVAPALPTNDLDVWIGPSDHITSLIKVERPTRSAWLAALQSLIGRWRTNCESDGANVFAYFGSPRGDWPAHVALRVIGRRIVEPANPVHVFNRRDVGRWTPGTQRAAVLDVLSVSEPQRWLLTPEDQLRTCMSCAPDRLEDYFIADIGGALTMGTSTHS